MDKWGYKGVETSLNGLTKWMEDNLRLNGNATSRHNECCRIIVSYGVGNIPDFVNKGHLNGKAHFIAKKIKWNKKFDHFIQWVKNNYSDNLKALLYE